MHSSKKGNQWYFGMKAHIGVDAESGLVHTVRGTSGHVSDIAEANSLLHGEEGIAFGDAGYQGIGNALMQRQMSLDTSRCERASAKHSTKKTKLTP